MIEDVLTLIFIAFALACFSKMLDFGLGYPNGSPDAEDEPPHISPNELLFFWTYFLSKKALNKNSPGQYNSYFKEYNELIDKAHFIINNDDIKFNHQKTIVKTGRYYFTWQKAVGMCIYCTNFWLCLIACLIIAFTFDFYIVPKYFLFCVPGISHFFIKTLKT